MTWDREKAYNLKRSAELMQEMDLAILTMDKVRFQRAYETATRYVDRKNLGEYMKKYAACMAGRY